MVYKPYDLPNVGLSGTYLVEPDGNLSLGPVCGRLKVAGITREVAEVALREFLEQWYRGPRVFLRAAGRAKWRLGRAPAIPYRIGSDDLLKVVAGIASHEPIKGEFRVAADGTVLLGEPHDKIALKGLSLEEAEKAVNNALRGIFPDPCAAVTLAGWEPDREINPLPQVAELLEAYVRVKENIDLPAYATLDDPEIVKRIGLTDLQRRALLRLMAENDIKWLAANPSYQILTGDQRASEKPEQIRKEARKRVEAVLTARQLQELKDLSFLKLAPGRLLVEATLKKIVDQGDPKRVAEIVRRRDELDQAATKRVETATEKAQIERETEAQRLKLLTPAESQRLREEIDRDDWSSLSIIVPVPVND